MYIKFGKNAAQRKEQLKMLFKNQVWKEIPLDSLAGC